MIFPNYLLNELVAKHKLRMNGMEALSISRENSGEFPALVDGLRDFVASESQNLTLPDVNIMLEVLTQRKQLLEAESCAAQNKLLLEFLKHLLQQKEDLQAQIIKEIGIIKSDIEEVEKILREVHSKCPTLEEVERAIASASEGDAAAGAVMKKELLEMMDNIKKDEPGSSTDTPSKSLGLSSLATRRRRMHAHFDDFVQCYFSSRSKELFIKDYDKTKSASAASSVPSGLDEFRENLVKFSRYNSLRRLASLNYSSDLFNNSTIVSSIEFDKDNEFFAIAGVTKRIKVFDYGAIIKDSVDIHYPCIEMVSTKLFLFYFLNATNYHIPRKFCIKLKAAISWMFLGVTDL